MNSGGSPCAPRYFELIAPSSRCRPLDERCAAEIAAPPPLIRAVAETSVPWICAMTRSTGPPGANCTTRKLIEHDPEDRRDHQQDAAEDVGCHSDPSACLADVRGLLGVEPPRRLEREGIGRLDLRPGEHVPDGDAMHRQVPVRNDVVLGADHAVERQHGGAMRVAVACGEDLVDQRVDGRSSDAREIDGAGRIGGGRSGRSCVCSRSASPRATRRRQRRRSRNRRRAIRIAAESTRRIVACTPIERSDVDVFSEHALEHGRKDRGTRPKGRRRPHCEGRCLHASSRLPGAAARPRAASRGRARNRRISAATNGLAEHLLRDVAAQRLEQRQLLRLTACPWPGSGELSKGDEARS